MIPKADITGDYNSRIIGGAALPTPAYLSNQFAGVHCLSLDLL